MGGEYAQGILLGEDDTADTRVTPALVCARLGLPAAPEVLAAFEDWISGLPPLDAFSIFDLGCNELRMAGWSSVQFPCDPVLSRFSPLMNWRIITLIFSLPPEWKRGRRLNREIISRQWPELAGVPFNTLGRWRDMQTKLRRAWDDPRLLAKKLRKLRGGL